MPDTTAYDAIIGLRCLICGAEYAPDEVRYVCPHHGNEGILDVRYDYTAIATRTDRDAVAASEWRSMWRYLPLLPVAEPRFIPPLDVGWTPLYRATRLGDALGLPHLWVKDDGRNPTASFKDRASALAVVKARELGEQVITTASSGNAAAALAGMAASAGLESVIFVPASAPQAKIAQLLIYGATVVLVEGTYDQAFDLCIEAANRRGWYCRNTAYNPYMTEGKKTAAYEIAEQLGWDAPDRVFVAVGDGCIIGGLHKGFADLLALGWIEHMPRLMGVQAEGSAALYEAWRRDTDEVTPITPHTIADSISVGLPRDRLKALRAVRETGGAFIAVSDEEILAAMRDLARLTGVFAEPAAAAALAGLRRALANGQVHPDERVVVLVTGNGLKDIPAAMRAVEGEGKAVRLQPTTAALDAWLGTHI